MARAVLFDLFETLITESVNPPPRISALGPQLGCEPDAFAAHWRACRPAVTVGRLSLRQALADVAAGLGGHADDATLRRICAERTQRKAERFGQIEPQVVAMLGHLRSRDVRLGVVSNCFAEDVVAWPKSSLARFFDCTVFSYEVGLAKPDPQIYLDAARLLRVNAADAWFIGDGMDEELAGAMQAGLRAVRALWFVKRWPNFREEPSGAASLRRVEDVSLKFV